MKTFLFLSIFLISFGSCAQISRYHQRKIERILGENFIQTSPQDSYRSDFECRTCDKDSSKVFVGHVDGAERNNELIMHHNLISLRNDSEAGKYIGTKAITISEYDAFENWVRDSLVYESIYSNLDSPYFRFKGFINAKTGRRITRKEAKLFYEEGRDFSRQFIHYNRNYPIEKKYALTNKNSAFSPLFLYLYIPRNQRFCMLREFDKRQYHYDLNNFESINQIDSDTLLFYFPDAQIKNWEKRPNAVLTYREEFEFAIRSTQHKDVHSVLGQVATKTLKNAPVYGVKGIQAKAFCDWKSEVLQTEFNNSQIPYRVEVTLPTRTDSDQHILLKPKVFVPQKSMNEQWQITNHEYKKFMDYVTDSIIREHLYLNIKSYHITNQLVRYQKYYLAESDFEFVNHDPDDREVNLEIFPLNYSSTINFENREIDSLLALLDLNELKYRYTENDTKERASKEFSLIDPNSLPTYYYDRKSFLYNIAASIETGKDRFTGNLNYLGETVAVRYHSNFQKFYSYKSTDIRPKQPKSIPDNDTLIQTITYEQALAFYNWKYPIHKANETSNWQDYLYPSQEEYNAVQNGEQVVLKGQSIDYISPTFRYVVHLYPK